MTEVVVGRPFEEFKLPDKERPKPDAVLHILGREAFASAAAATFRQIHEGTFLGLQGLQALELPDQCIAGRRRKAVAGPRCTDQPRAIVVAEDRSVEVYAKTAG